MAQFEASFQRKPTMLMHQYELNLNYAFGYGGPIVNYQISENGINGTVSIGQLSFES